MDVEKQIKEYEAKNGPLPVHNKSVLRNFLEKGGNEGMQMKDDEFWDKYVEREEVPHGHSPLPEEGY